MKQGNWLWKVGRILLAVVLLAAVFKWTVKLTDTVELTDGTEVRGTIVSFSEAGVVVETHGESVTYPLSDVAEQQGQLVIEWGLAGLLRRMEAGPAVLAVLLLGIAPFIASWRWQMLLRAQEIHVSLGKAIQLTFVGLFFNNFMPGLTGGDVIKAYYAAKLTSTKKPHAVVTVFLDRVIGMVALGLVAGIAIIVGFAGTGAAGGKDYQRAAWFVAAFIAVSVVGGIGFYSRRLRRVLSAATKALPGYETFRRNRLVDKVVSVVRHVDAALFLYRSEKMVLVNTTAVSFVAHTSAILAIYFIGRALGITQASVLQYFVVVPVCFIVSSVPSTPGAWGVGEVVFKVLFGTVGVPGTAAVTLSVIYRLSQAFWTLPGGVLLMFQRDRATVEEMESEIGMEESLEQARDGAEGG